MSSPAAQRSVMPYTVAAGVVGKVPIKAASKGEAMAYQL